MIEPILTFALGVFQIKTHDVAAVFAELHANQMDGLAPCMELAALGQIHRTIRFVGVAMTFFANRPQILNGCGQALVRDRGTRCGGEWLVCGGG